MLRLRVTKYDPASRDRRGVYTVDEWTCVSDIGRSFESGSLTETEYLKIEDTYIACIMHLLGSAYVDKMAVVALEGSSGFDCKVANTSQLIEQTSNVRLGEVLHREEVEAVSRLTLRTLMWVKLLGDDNTYVHFGYDYYMYLGTDRENGFMQSPPRGLFYEEFESPYDE